MKMILAALKEVFISHSPSNNFTESMIKWDFKIGEPKQNLMQLAFSNLAAWPLVLIIALIWVDPFQNSWSLVKLLSEDSSLVFNLLDGHGQMMLMFFFMAFVAEWLFRTEYFCIALLLYFLNRSELHVNLAAAAVLAVFFSRNCYLWWMVVDCESEARKIWNWVCGLQMAAWVLVCAGAIFALDYAHVTQLFNVGSGITRLGFLSAVLAALLLVSHLLLGLWGHFYFKSEHDPSFLRLRYSTSNWILRFKMSSYLQYLLKQQAEAQLQKHNVSQAQFDELKVANPGLVKLSVEKTLKGETAYLKEAILRLNKI